MARGCWLLVLLVGSVALDGFLVWVLVEVAKDVEREGMM